MREERRRSWPGLAQPDQLEGRERFAERMDKLRNTAVDEFLKVLSRSQHAELVRIVNSAGVNRAGLLASLIELPLGNEIGVTNDQKEKLRVVAEKTRNHLAKQTREIEARYEIELLSVLTDEQRKLFSRIVGAPAEGGFGNLTIIIKQSDPLYLSKFQ